MPNARVLDVIEALLRAADHPDYQQVARYGRDTLPGGQSPAGVKALHKSGSTSMLWCAAEPRDAHPVPADAVDGMTGSMPARTLRLAHRLLDAARPPQFSRWELCAAPGVGWPESGKSPSALRITGSDGTVAYLRATAASGPGGGKAEPKEDPFPEWQVPDAIADAVPA
ncbi:hypothetical protein ACIBCR_15530 [Micromonospora echinospora]|uniref:hypothetical protein n=1 Tax=Micromonospora echinospora TaxID=1877 RepID=UPI0037AC4C10